LKKVPWGAEKYIYCAVAGWNILKTSVMSTRSVLSFSCRGLFGLLVWMTYLLLVEGY
jgi:hypothetical protein